MSSFTLNNIVAFHKVFRWCESNVAFGYGAPTVPWGYNRAPEPPVNSIYLATYYFNASTSSKAAGMYIHNFPSTKAMYSLCEVIIAYQQKKRKKKSF